VATVTQAFIGLTTAVIGALFGALATYATQRFFNRARVYIEYAEIAYEGIFSLSVNTQQGISLYNALINYVDVQANWNFRRLLAANFFNREELLVLQNICTTFKGHQSQILARIDKILSMVMTVLSMKNFALSSILTMRRIFNGTFLRTVLQIPREHFTMSA
jgi:hypothetical protein